MERNIHETQEFYAVANEEGRWFVAHNGPYVTKRNAQKEADRACFGTRKYRVVKMIPIFFDAETGERITPMMEVE